MNRYDLGGNTNKIATEENFKFDHADLNESVWPAGTTNASLKDDVLKNREEECTVGGEMQIAALAAAVSTSLQQHPATLIAARTGQAEQRRDGRCRRRRLGENCLPERNDGSRRQPSVQSHLE